MFKSFESMTREDYEKAGFKSGLEIHQQLLTRRKLFCRCPAGIYTNDYDAEILRHMRPTLSELGEYDGTALMEFKTRKNIIYQLKNEVVCTYEMDDAPPFKMDDQALDISMEIAALLNCNLVSEIHITRKQYLDGSIPTGFQRTCIVGVEGKIPYGNREIGIIQLGLEEDSCREVSDKGHNRVYKMDRLGMPLIETVTYPEMKTPQEVADVAQILRRLVRVTGKVRTGIGAGRQDVNVSITGGTRIEIKGVPKITAIPRLVYNEAKRQYNLLKIKSILEERGVTTDNFDYSQHDVTEIVRNTQFNPVLESVEKGNKIKAILIRKYAGILSHETQDNTIFAKEVEDRLRVIACVDSLPNYAYARSIAETIEKEKWNDILKAVGAKNEDEVILLWADEYDMETATNEVIIRLREVLEGIPSETRQALDDGTNGFERILPGADRMYPDTDSPPIPITEEHFSKVLANIPPRIWELERKYRAMGLSGEMSYLMPLSGFRDDFEKLVDKYSTEARLIAGLLLHQGKNLKRAYGIEVDFELIDIILEAYKKNAITKDALGYILMQKAKDKNIADMLKEYANKERPSADELANEVNLLAQKYANETFKSKPNKIRYCMGELMSKYFGIIEGNKIYELLNNNL